MPLSSAGEISSAEPEVVELTMRVSPPLQKYDAWLPLLL